MVGERNKRRRKNREKRIAGIRKISQTYSAESSIMISHGRGGSIQTYLHIRVECRPFVANLIGDKM